MKRLENKTAIITGATSGIGRATLLRFLEDGAGVLFTARHKEEGLALEADLRAKGFECIFAQADASVYDDNVRIVKLAAERWGRIDCVVCNAGQAWRKPFHEIEPDAWDEVVKTNYSSAFYLCKSVIPQMAFQGGGSVIFVSSGMTSVPSPEMGHYIATKAALESLARCLSLEYCRQNIRFNAILPGPMYTAAFERIPKKQLEDVLKAMPTHEFCKAEDVAGVISFMASDDAKLLTGARITADLADGCGKRFD